MTKQLTVERLPDLEELLGWDEKAEMDAERIRGLARALRHFKTMQQIEGLKETDQIPNAAPQPDGSLRTFGEQYAMIHKAHEAFWEKIDNEGHRALVEQKLRASNT